MFVLFSFILVFRILTINIRGLNTSKLDLINDYICRFNIDVCFVQETQVSSEQSIQSLSSRWVGHSFWSPALGRQGGVVVLFPSRFSGVISSWKKDSEGRIVSVLVSLGSFKCNLVNVYAPTNRSDRSNFFLSVHQFFFPNSRIIIGGDFNCYDSALDKFGGNVSLSSDLSSFKSCFNLVDAWRCKHPRVSQCSWFNSDLSIGSRLDSFLVARDLLSSLSSCEITPCVFSDHEFVTLDVDLSHVFEFGPGVWKFNNSLLDDRVYCGLVSDLIDQHLNFRHVFISVKDFWESLKDVIRNRTIIYSRAKRRELSRDRVRITNRLIKLKSRLVSGDVSVKPEILELESALNAIFNQELEGIKIRSRAEWLEEGEKPSRYFFKLGRERFDQNCVFSIYDSSGTEVSDRAGLINAHEVFYANLFSREEIDLFTQQELFSNLSLHLSEDDRDRCEGLLSLSELTTALGNMSRNKSPGPDGLSVEFYSKFWNLLGPILRDVINLCYADSDLCDSMKTSYTRLVFKKGDRKSLKNWRPISLLNVDYKICSKALSSRLSLVLEKIVTPDQTCSVPGRSISSNLVMLRDMLDYIDRTNESGILISLDQEKAFDRVDRSFLMNLLQHFGFGPSFCRWILTLYHGANMQIMINGWLSRKIELQRGVRQGDSLSPMLYILCVEVLAAKIRSTPAIEGFLLPGARGKSFKVGQYADDTTGFLKSLYSLRVLLDVVSVYEKGSGAKLNRSKSEAMWVGSWKDRVDQPLGLTWVKKMKILGVFFGVIDVQRDNWEPKLSKLDKMLTLWKSRSLSMVGKSLIINTLGVSKLLYLSRILITPRWVIDRYNGLIWNFLWGSKIEPVARKTLHCPVVKGGLGIVDFEVKGRALRLASTLAVLEDPVPNCFFLAKYFCGSRLARFGSKWACLRDNSSPSASLPTLFYSGSLSSLEKLARLPSSFVFSSKNIYRELLKELSSPPILPRFWSPFLRPAPDMEEHWALVRDSRTENFKNDLSWLITLKAVKVRESLRNWGYIASDKCASCPRRETIDHCFLNCSRVKLVWAFFVPLLSALLTPPVPFVPNCVSIFFFRFPPCVSRNRAIIIYLVKSILYGVWKFRNKATFHNGTESDRAIIRYIIQDVTTRIKLDHYRLPAARFSSLWVHPEFCLVVGNNHLTFPFINRSHVT